MQINGTIADILGTPFWLVSCDDVLAAIEGWRQRSQRHYVCVSNPHSVMLARRDLEMLHAVRSAAVVVPDGVGIILAARLLGYRHQGRIPGPTFMLRLADAGRQYAYRHFFFGGKPGVAQALAERLGEHFPGLVVAGTMSPPFRPLSDEEDADIINRINATEPDVVWVGLGAPKQEKWMASHRGRIASAAMIGVGAAFDFHSGNKHRAPAWMRNWGLEWAYRTLENPVAMLPRRINEALFLLLIVRQAVRVRGRGRFIAK